MGYNVLPCPMIQISNIKSFYLINYSNKEINSQLPTSQVDMDNLVEPLFVQFIFVQPVFVQTRFSSNPDSSNLLSSMTCIRPIYFRPILVHFLFLSKKKQKLDFVKYLGFFPLKDMQTAPPPQFWSGFHGWLGVCCIVWEKIMKKISDLHFSSYHRKLGWTFFWKFWKFLKNVGEKKNLASVFL